MPIARTGVIYGIKASTDDRVCYVGQTRQKPETRFKQHTHGRTPLTKALRMFQGADMFSLVVLEEVPEKLLDERERHWIVALNTLHPNGLNMMGGGAAGRRSEATKERMRAASKKRWADPDYREKMAAGVSSWWTDERRARISKALTDHVRSPEHTEKLRAAGSAALKAMHQDQNPEVKKKRSVALSVALKGRVFSDEAKARMSTAAKARCASPEWRARASARQKEKCANPEYIKNLSATAKEAWLDPAYVEKWRVGVARANQEEALCL